MNNRRNSVPTQDTLTSAQAAIAAIIVNSTLAQYVGYPGRPLEERLDNLKRIANGEGKPGAWNFISVEFRRAGTNCSLSVNCESDNGYREEYTQDEAGNDYVRTRVLPPQLNWPSHGNLGVGTSFACIEFYRDVARLAADIESEFRDQHFWRLARTKAQREEQEAKAKQQKVEEAVTNAIEQVRNGARIGGTPKSVPMDLIAAVPDGDYDRTFSDNKAFKLTVRRVDDMVCGMWVRTA